MVNQTFLILLWEVFLYFFILFLSIFRLGIVSFMIHLRRLMEGDSYG